MSNSGCNDHVTIREMHEKYLFRRKLGKGSFSDVFLATDRVTGENVAIKMMKIDSCGNGPEKNAERFRREMMLYRQLEHPNIVKMIDSGETDTGLLYIAFEYIRGESLAALLRKEGAFTIYRTLNLMNQILNGLTIAHSKGIIHRDLKPENIMVIPSDEKEKIKILDFGISFYRSGVASESLRLTGTTEFLGTPLYAAPEQLRGEAVSVKADIYAWGLIFLECICGKSPFTGKTVASVVQQQLASSQVPLPVSLVNHRLGTLLRWTLEKNAERRAGNAFAIASHLQTLSIDGIYHNRGYLDCQLLNNTNGDNSSELTNNCRTLSEKRQVTMLCCILDTPEYYKIRETEEPVDEIYQDLMNSAGEILTKHESAVRIDGTDRIMACFGYPEASDTDAQRAARSALELANVFTRGNSLLFLHHGIRLTYRIAIHTGKISVMTNQGNKALPGGLMSAYSVKLCGATETNSVFVSRDCYLLIKDHMVCHEVIIDNKKEAFIKERIYKLTSESQTRTLLETDDKVLTPMAGRDGELERITDIWRSVEKYSAGRVIMLQGEAGIGKSRLAAEFAKRIVRDKYGWMEYRCLPEKKRNALHPIIDVIRKTINQKVSEGNNNFDEMLANLLINCGIDCSMGMAVFGVMLGLQADGDILPQMTPRKKKDFMLKAAADIVVKTAERNSSVIMIEDLHWADQLTLELLPLLFESVKKRGLLLIMSARPVLVPDWKNGVADIIQIDRLNNNEIENIVRNLAGSDVAGQDTVAEIVERVDGVPLFAEEVTRMICEKGILKGEIPSTLRDLLNGRIDRLGPARETAQVASVIGREFDYRIIEKVSFKDEASLLADLDQLISAGILQIQLVVGNPRYVFRHALVRDAAFDSIDKKVKKEIAGRVSLIAGAESETGVKYSPDCLKVKQPVY